MKIAIITALADLSADADRGRRKEIGLPPYVRFGTGSTGIKIPPPVPNLGPVILATVLKNSGYDDVSIVDFYADPDGSLTTVQAGGFAILLLHTSFMVTKTIIDIATLARKHNPDACIIAGGQVAFEIPDLLLDNGYVDHVVLGEGETLLPTLVQAINRGDDLRNFPGIYAKEETRDFPLIENIDTIPFPDWGALDLRRYIPSFPVETIRGCPYACNYCSESLFWKKPVRYKSVARVVDEMENNIGRYGASMFRFIDSTFSFPTERALELCREIVRRGLDIRWTCFVRADSMTEALAAAMADAGCVAVFIGAESGSDYLLGRMNKHSSSGIIRNAICILKKHGIFVHANFIIGYPGETDATVMETVSLIRETLPGTFSMSSLYISRGTNLYEERERHGIRGMLDEWESEDGGHDACINLMHAVYRKHLARLDNSYYCFGGEWAVNFLLAMGFDLEDCVAVFRAMNDVCSKPALWVVYQHLRAGRKRGALSGFYDILGRYEAIMRRS